MQLFRSKEVNSLYEINDILIAIYRTASYYTSVFITAECIILYSFFGECKVHFRLKNACPKIDLETNEILILDPFIYIYICDSVLLSEKLEVTYGIP